LLVNRGRVARTISKGKHAFATLMMESAPSSCPLAQHPSVQPLLQEFEDVFPRDLPPGLPSKIGIEHQIDLILGAPLPKKPTYRCNPTETKELQRQVQELIDRGYVRGTMSPLLSSSPLGGKERWQLENMCGQQGHQQHHNQL